MYDATQKNRLFECFDSVDFTVYGDFNCPFSYALNERLFALNLEYRVDFRMVQHAADVHSEQVNLEVLSALTTEVAEVRRRAPSTEINVPMFRPCSAAAAALVYTICRLDPIEAVQLRRRIFRAFWVEGQDISKPGTLAALLLDMGLELASPYPLSNEELSTWQSEWANNTEFDGNLPVVISENGETVVGFLLEPELDAFLTSGSLISEQATGGHWEPQKRQRILVLDNDASSLRVIIEQMHDAQVEVVEDFIGLIANARNLGMPDLLLVNTALIGDVSGTDWWRNLTNSNPDPAIPIIHILDNSTPAAETAAVDSGAADFVTRPFHPKLLRSRLNSHLRARLSRQQYNKIARVDALTSICNRREFDARLITDWGRGARSGDSLALLMIDFDQLGDYNQNCGHSRGDQCLVSVAQMLGGCMQRSGDLIARYGGGLFVALLPGVEIESALQVARDCLETVANAKIPHPAATAATHVTVSIGVTAMVPIFDKSCTLLVEQASISLYQAKQEGRNRVCAFDSGT